MNWILWVLAAVVVWGCAFGWAAWAYVYGYKRGQVEGHRW